MINHHLSDEMILSYAAGSLSAGQAMVVHCHLEICPDCMARVREAEALGGALLEHEAELGSLSLDFDEFLSQIDTLPEESQEMMPSISSASARKRQARIDKPNSFTPDILHDLLGHGLEDVSWKMVGPGIRQYHLPQISSDGETVRLLKLSPGFVTPQHSHHGSELTLVLQGSFCDETGRYAVGDIQDADGDLDHQPIADTEQDCICLTVTDAPLEFKGIISRLFQPIIRI